MAQFCPVFRPSYEEFSDFKRYIKKIESKAWEYGIIKVIPPPTWNPRHAPECCSGPGDFTHPCIHSPSLPKSSSSLPSFEIKPEEVTYSKQYFGENCPDNHKCNLENSKQYSLECICNLSNIYPLSSGSSEDNYNSSSCSLCNHFSSLDEVDLKNNDNDSLIKNINEYNQKQNDADCSKEQETKEQPCNITENCAKIEIKELINYGQQHTLYFNSTRIYKVSNELKKKFVHIFYPYDRMWYEGVVISTNIPLNSFNVRFIHDNKDKLVYLHENLVMLLPQDSNDNNRKQNSTNDNDNDNNNNSNNNNNYKVCRPLIAHELKKRLDDMNDYQDHYSLGYTGWNKNVALSDFIIKSPIRQTAYQVQNSRAGVYNIINMVEKKKITVKDFLYESNEELKKELSNYKKSKNILEWINSDSIEEHFDEIEREWTRNLAYIHPLYGADTPGTLFHQQSIWNPSNYGTILNYVNNNIQGVNTPYLYFGRWRAMFAWHIEDRALYAINYLHFGKPKIWYGIPLSDYNKMESVLASLFKTDSSSCPVFTRHKTSFVTPKLLQQQGITVYRSIQRANEIIITCPKAYHSGFNLGFNCAESVNFATPAWIPIGLTAPTCTCGLMENAVSFDIYEIINKITTNLPHLVSEIPPLPKVKKSRKVKKEVKEVKEIEIKNDTENGNDNDSDDDNDSDNKNENENENDNESSDENSLQKKTKKSKKLPKSKIKNKRSLNNKSMPKNKKQRILNK